MNINIKGRKKLDTLVEYEGYEDEMQLLNDRGADCTTPGICMNDGCDYTIDTEPDADHNWCEDCNTNSVASFMRIMRII